MTDKKYVTVIGGANIDFGASVHKRLIYHDSNVGKITLSAGGVGRNIAENLVKLGIKTELITAFGDDANASFLISDCTKKGIGISHSLTVKDTNTSGYLYIVGPDGEMELAVNDMDVIERLTPSFIESEREIIEGSSAVVIDANLSKETIAYIAQNFDIPIFADPVSGVKAERLKAALPKLYAVKPNLYEAGILSGNNTNTAKEAVCSAKSILDKGVKQVYITLGRKGILAVNSDEELFIKNLPVKIVDTTGAGDAFTAAIVWAFVSGLGFKSACTAGISASAVTLETKGAVNRYLSDRMLTYKMMAAKWEIGTSADFMEDENE